MPDEGDIDPLREVNKDHLAIEHNGDTWNVHSSLTSEPVNFSLSPSEMSADHIHFFLQLRTQIKLYHWQTRVYARHIATDKILEQLDEAIDSFVEIYLGTYGRNKLTGKNATVTLQNLTEAGAVRLLQHAVKYLQGPLSKSLKPKDTDLTNLRDEMVGQLHQLLYLFSLH